MNSCISSLQAWQGQLIGEENLSSNELAKRVQEWETLLLALRGEHAVGLMLANGANWVAIDMAAANTQTVLVPMPAFFTDEQLAHLCQQAGVSLMLTDELDRVQRLGFALDVEHKGVVLACSKQTVAPVNMPANIAKITFTSGTTGQPKGVCLTEATQLSTASALTSAIADLGIKRHLSLLPFSVLLENIAGIYSPLLAGADLICPPVEEVGLLGVNRFDAQMCLDQISKYQAESVVLLPQMLFALLSALLANDTRLASLKMIAVGGGKVPASLLAWADMLGLPVFEGYGLSECASVVCLNTPQARKAGTVGKPLQALEVKVSHDGELLVRGRHFSGYLTERGFEPAELDLGWLATGDIGSIDDDGFVSISGRKKHLIITSFGRNVSPEWPESLLLSTGLFMQCVVFGDSQAALCAVLVPREGAAPEAVQAAVTKVNLQLPEYAHINQFIVADAAFDFQNGLVTANGRLKRDAIWAAYAECFSSTLETLL